MNADRQLAPMAPQVLTQQHTRQLPHLQGVISKLSRMCRQSCCSGCVQNVVAEQIEADNWQCLATNADRLSSACTAANLTAASPAGGAWQTVRVVSKTLSQRKLKVCVGNVRQHVFMALLNACTAACCQSCVKAPVAEQDESACGHMPMAVSSLHSSTPDSCLTDGKAFDNGTASSSAARRRRLGNSRQRKDEAAFNTGCNVM